jgi:hypothetical protein
VFKGEAMIREKKEKDKRYWLLSGRWAALLSFFTIILVALVVFLLGHKAFIKELEITLLIISLCLFSFLFIGLYRGVRVKNKPIVEGEWKSLGSEKYLDVMSYGPDFTPALEIGEGLGGMILGIIAWILITIVALFLLFFLANILWGVVFVLGVVIYWIFYRALRLAFVKSRLCKGKFGQSLGYSSLYTGLYIGWFISLS